MKVLCVCLGNTCRSPMMEVFLQDELAKLELEDFQVESAGTLKEAEGKPANELSRLEVAKRGLSLDAHVARHIGSIGDLSAFDLILCVGSDEAGQVTAICPEARDLIEVVNAATGGIPNPYQLGREAYRTCAETIKAAMAEIAHRLK